jgi:hypothetical protein
MFVGASHAEIVALLVREFAEVKRDRRARLVVLRGEPGWGKTRIVQEFYQRAAATQSEPAYWPPRIFPEDAELSEGLLRNTRKTVRPTGFIPAAALPAYLWIGTAADEGKGLRADTGVDQVIDQISDQLAPIFLAAARRQAARRGMGAIISLAGLGPLGAILDPAMAAVDVRQLALALRDVFRTPRAAVEPVRPDGRLEEKLGAFRNAVELIWRSALREGPPGVLVIEDAHAIRRPTGLLIDELLLAPGLPFLVIALGQPSRANDDELDRLVRDDRPGVRVVDLIQMHDSDLVKLVLEAFPRTHPEIAQALSEQASGNPYALRLMLLSLRRRQHDGALTASSADIRALPSGIDDLLLTLWHELPDHAQRVLNALAVVGPRSLTRVDDTAVRVVQRGSDGTNWPPAAEVSATGWLRQLGDWRQFLEVARWRIARRHTLLSSAEEERILIAGQTAMEELLNQGPDDPRLADLDTGLLQEAVQRDTVRNPVAATKRLTMRANALTLDQRHAEAEDTAGLAYRAAGQHMRTNLDVALALMADARRVAAQARRGTGRGRYDPQALDYAEESVTLARRATADQPDVLIRCLVGWSRSLRRLDDQAMLRRARACITEARSLITEPEYIEPQTYCDLLRAEYVWPSFDGDRSLAAQMARAAHQVHVTMYGTEHPYTLECLVDEAYYLFRIEPRRAVRPREQLLEAATRLWGEGHPRTARRAKDLALTLIRAEERSRASEAHHLAAAAHRAMIETRGHNSNDTLQCATTLARAKLFLAEQLQGPPAAVLRRDALALATHAWTTKRDQQSGSTLDLWPQREVTGLAQAALGDPAGAVLIEQTVQERRARLAERGLQPDDRLELTWAVTSLIQALRMSGSAVDIDTVKAQYLSPITPESR